MDCHGTVKDKYDTTAGNSVMKTIIVLIVTLTGAHGEVIVSGPKKVTGLVGHTVNVPCTYNMLYVDNVKYWCRGTLRSKCHKKASTDGSVVDSRVSILDNKLKGVFHITIKSLMKEDAGYYQCVISRNFFFIDNSHDVYLNVSTDEDVQVSPSPKPNTGDLR
ncbi:hypothetical protein JZ751_003886 [Albula glossodonta]|uniref:Immunoglobulin domain-containing protein n=1 Tax=Albula glossodonta TaxID=121402 RepID=A0A8T2P7K2_9TELE|nr:hypothetical protein JZ751_003886 [Albula glossodonta]